MRPSRGGLRRDPDELACPVRPAHRHRRGDRPAAGALAEAVATPEWEATGERNYWREAPLQGEEFDRFIAEEIERIRGLFEEMGL